MGWDGRSENVLPRMDWYPQDYLADRKTRCMTLEEHGAYFILLQTEWLDGPLPIDHTELADLLTVSERAFERVWVRVSRCFVEEDGHFVNPRLERERDQALSHRRERQESGRKGGLAKAELKQRQKELVANPSPSPSPSPLPSPSPSPTPKKEKTKETTTLSVSATPSPDIETVFDHFRAIHPRARLTKKRRTLIAGHLRDGYTVDDLTLALDGLHLDRWHIEKGNLTIEYGLRNGDKIDGLMEVASNPSHPKRLNGTGPVLSESSRRSIEAGKRWIERRGNNG